MGLKIKLLKIVILFAGYMGVKFEEPSSLREEHKF